MIRIQKALSMAGFCSRRKAEEYMQKGKVKVNGKIVTELGTKVDIANDVIQVGKEIVRPEDTEHIYIVMNKERGVITSLKDPEGRRTVIDYIPALRSRVFPIGRLDYLSEGLLLLTNDGEFAHETMHPSKEVEKVYEVKVFGKVTKDLLKKMRTGVVDKGQMLKPVSVRVIEQLPRKTWLEFRLVGGKNREIRRICEAFSLSVDKLRRVAIGSLSISGIAPGKYQFIEKKDLERLVKSKEKYISPKRTIKVKEHHYKENTPIASERVLQKYNKDNYLDTMASYRKIEAEEKAKAKLAAKEAEIALNAARDAKTLEKAKRASHINKA